MERKATALLKNKRQKQHPTSTLTQHKEEIDSN
jgi:hypothetical protein